MRWENFDCERIGEGIRITKYIPDGDEDSVLIPSYIEGMPVTEIGAEAFADEGMFLCRAEIPPTVKRIGDGAFRMCVNLTELILHEGLEEICEGALSLTPLSEVVLPDSVREIGCPWELGSIRFFVSDGNPRYYTDGFCLFRRNGPDERTAGIGEGSEAGNEARADSPGAAEWRLLVSFREDLREEYEIPEGTTVIGENAFSGNEALVRVTVPESVKIIGEAAFEGCRNLSEITLGEGVREIGAEAFGHCIRLKYLHLPASVEMLGESALSDTFGWSDLFLGLERITVDPDNKHFEADEDALFEIAGSGSRYLVKYFGDEGEYRIPGDVERILPEAFRRAGFYCCEIPASVRSVGRDAFRECRNLSEIVIGETGSVLYIPGQPIYRKDEVTALFFEERADGGCLYDYEGYDALFGTYLNLPDLCGMACCRLKYPIGLSDERSREYRDFLTGNLPGILGEIAKKQDMERLVMLAELGLFNDENIDESLDILSRAGRTKFTGFLLNWRREHGGIGDFDFTL